MPTKSIQQSSLLEALITSHARIAVLTLLVLNAENRYYLREIESLTHQPVRAVQRELSRLQKAGLVVPTPEGNRKYYQVNRDSPVFPELKGLLVKTVGLGDLLRESLSEGSGAIELAFIFGSYARGSEMAASDIDLFVIGEITGRKLSQILAPARETLLREINTVIMNAREASRKYAEGSEFLGEVFEESKIFLIGDENELKEILSGRQHQAP